jgi:hypothetical protein
MRLERSALPYEDFAVSLENRRHHLKHVNIGAQMPPARSAICRGVDGW